MSRLILLFFILMVSCNKSQNKETIVDDFSNLSKYIGKYITVRGSLEESYKPYPVITDKNGRGLYIETLKKSGYLHLITPRKHKRIAQVIKEDYYLLKEFLQSEGRIDDSSGTDAP
jgi:hypothetical protein